MTRLLKPNYDRSRLKPRLLHIGFGAFAKAHVMVFHDEMLHTEASDWGVVATRLHSGIEDLDRLDQSDGLYSVGEMSDDDLRLRQVGVLTKTLHPRRDGPDSLLNQIAEPELGVVTMTITEKGYCLSGGRLDLQNSGIRQDLISPASPETAIGVLVEGLSRRRNAGLSGLTILSCDNLPENGRLCQSAVLDFAEHRDPELASWIRSKCRFPCSMVDRITPAMTEESFSKLADALGYSDPNGVLCEPFRQWVIEDNFAGARPDWDLAGAEFIEDVAPFEEMKLRLLNGSHSFLAYLGALGDKETIADCMEDPILRAAVTRLMFDEQAPTLRVPQGVDIERYAKALLERFSNRALHHKTTQIASDGSQKLPQRLLAPVRQHLAEQHGWRLSSLAIAGWMLYCRGRSETGASLPVNDPLAARISEISMRTDGDAYVHELLSLEDVFGNDLPDNADFVESISSAYRTLQDHGVLKSLSNSL
ncbi:mannitol dehydrogenase family protein [Roseibium sp.]|uniref:mannitol dehydrogenase family protein n=1 Tax=Roseibium sp. TaxID=1936156 RepID=UPI0039F10E1C